MNQLEYITEKVSKHNGKVLTFDSAVIVKSSPHTPVFTCWGLMNGADGLYLMDYVGDWHGPLKREQAFANLVIASLYQRLKSIELETSVVVANYDKEVNAVIFE